MMIEYRFLELHYSFAFNCFIPISTEFLDKRTINFLFDCLEKKMCIKKWTEKPMLSEFSSVFSFFFFPLILGHGNYLCQV